MAQAASTPEQLQFDASRLLRQVPAIAELAQLDASGREQLRVSRTAVDEIGSNTDLSNHPSFINAMANKVYYGSVYFRRESEPYDRSSSQAAEEVRIRYYEHRDRA